MDLSEGQVKLLRMSARLNRTVKFDGTPVFQGQALMLGDARRHGWPGQLVSADRRKGVAERFGKLSQAALFAAWVAWSTRHVILAFMRGQRPNPANSPGHSTHELRSDGVAYRGPVGRPLVWWKLGLDVTEWDELLHVLHELGYLAKQPYHSGSELHHVNLYRNPTRRLRKRGLIHSRTKRARHRVLHAVRARITKVSAACVDMVARFEGGRGKDGRFHAYFDKAGGVWTIGYGHTKGVRPGMVWSAAKARRVLRRELNRSYAPAVADLKLPLTQPMFDALVSAVYNLGPAVLGTQHTLGAALHKRRWHAAADALLLYVHAANGAVEPGLVTRRKAERALFLSGAKS